MRYAKDIFGGRRSCTLDLMQHSCYYRIQKGNMPVLGISVFTIMGTTPFLCVEIKCPENSISHTDLVPALKGLEATSHWLKTLSRSTV